MQKTINSELGKLPMPKWFSNTVDRRDLMSIRSMQKVKTI